MFQALGKLGRGDTFTVFADFSGFTGRKDVVFDDVIHEAMIQVDEEGSNDPAGSVRDIDRSSASGTSEVFVCDRPFAYIIYDYFQSKIRVMGTFREPISA